MQRKWLVQVAFVRRKMYHVHDGIGMPKLVDQSLRNDCGETNWVGFLYCRHGYIGGFLYCCRLRRLHAIRDRRGMRWNGRLHPCHKTIITVRRTVNCAACCGILRRTYIELVDS